jgi:hypothetical protein
MTVKRKLLIGLWWAGPWLGLAFFAWRQQTLEANLSAWVDKTTRLMEFGVGRVADAVEADAAESVHGIVSPNGG